MYFFFTYKPCFSASCWVHCFGVNCFVLIYMFSIHMIVRTFCGQSVFSWLLSHSVWQRVKHFSFTCLLLIIFCLFDCCFNWSDCFINVLISGSPPGYSENHSRCSAHKNHRSHLLNVYAYFLGVGDMGRILIQSPGSFRFCRNAQASSLWEATRNNKCEYVLGTVGQFIIALLTTMALHYLLITKCCTPNSFLFFKRRFSNNQQRRLEKQPHQADSLTQMKILSPLCSP